MFPHWSTPGVETASYTPSWTASSNPAIGNGTLTGRYMRFGKLVVATINLTCGTTTTFGSGQWSFSLPFTAISTSHSGSAWAFEDGVGWYSCMVHQATTTTVIGYFSNNGNGINSGFPFTWGSLDKFDFTITYEAA